MILFIRLLFQISDLFKQFTGSIKDIKIFAYRADAYVDFALNRSLARLTHFESMYKPTGRYCDDCDHEAHWFRLASCLVFSKDWK